ncbi:hypothetical protein B1151_04120 [Enterococcus faecium]|nr:hypothetical protein B1151_04120 [Enterococcus faecium]
MTRLYSSQSLLRINGVQKLASAVIILTKRKIREAIFGWLVILLDAGQLCNNPSFTVFTYYALLIS